MPELRIQYKDFASWQNARLSVGLLGSDIIKKQEEYWLNTFSKEIPVLNIHTDYPRPAIQSFEGDRVFFTVGEKITQGLEDIAARSGATMYMVLLAAFNVLLAKYSGQEDIVVGTPIMGRKHADLENIVGLFSNILAMRNYPEGNKTFVHFLEEIKSASFKAFENQDYQFEEFVSKLGVKRDLVKNPLFDVTFIMQNMNLHVYTTKINTRGLKFKPYEFNNRVSRFDITLSATEIDNSRSSMKNLQFELEYSTKLFKKETIDRLKEHFIKILHQIVKFPEIRLAEIDILTAKESFNELKLRELRAFLLKELPDYMIPSYFVQLEKLPLTSNGKIDRKAMPEPDCSIISRVGYESPRNEIEARLVEIWQSVLGVKKVGINDNFFELGGDSLKAVRVIGRLDGYSINVMSIMQYPTIAELQAHVTILDEKHGEMPPSMAENLAIEYFYSNDGTPDQVARFLDCSAQMIYFTLKKKVKNYQDYLELLLQDIVFYVIQNPNGSIYDINLLPYPFRGDIFSVDYVESQGYQAMGEIEKLLDKGEQVVLGTCARRVPFHKDFDGFDSPYLPIKKGHTFLVVAHNDTDLYYVEIPSVLNAAYFVQYPKNKSIGIIKKTDLKAAFEVFADFGTISINQANLHQGSNLKALFQISLDNYAKGALYQDGLKVSYGQNALDLLIDLSGEECLRLDTVEGLYNATHIFHLFEWKFFTIGARRKILMDALAGNTQACNIQVKNSLIDILDKSYKEWHDTQEMTKRKFWMEKDYKVGREYQARFIELKALEQEIMENLTKLWQ